MLPGWQNLKEQHERIRWARRNALYDQALDAAKALGIEPNTYRSYERATADGGRLPKLSSLQRIADRFGVSWVWLADGRGDPTHGIIADDDALEIADKVRELPKDKRADALKAALSVLDSYIPKRA